MQNGFTPDLTLPLNQDSNPEKRSSDLLRRKTDSLNSLNFQNNILLQIYIQHLRAHGCEHDCEQACQKKLAIIHKLADFLSKRGILFVDVKPDELKRFLAWIQKKSHSNTLTRQYTVAIIEFFLTLLQEGAIVTNPVHQLYPILTNHVILNKEELDTPVPIHLVEQISQYIGEQTQNPIGPLPLPVPQHPKTSLKIPTGELIHRKQTIPPPKSRQTLRNLFQKTGLSFHRLALYLLVIAIGILFNHVAFVSTVLEWVTKTTVDTVTNQAAPKYSTDPSAIRKHYYFTNQISNTFCQTILKIDCHTNALPTNPLPASWDNLVAGQVLFDRLCQECHGFQGKGGGPLATNMNPPPTRLEFAGEGILDKDLYLYWTIHDGGIPTDSQMPAFKKILTAEEIWQLILFINSL